MSDNVKKHWEDFLNPEILRTNLIRASIYIAAYESLLKEAIIGRPKEMYTTGWNIEDGETVSVEYKTKVLSRNRNILYASFDWLRENGAVNQDDLSSLDRIKKCRNNLAHRLLEFLGKEGLPSNFEQCFNEMTELISKIEKWWIINVEIPTNPDVAQGDIDFDGIVPGRIITLRFMCDIALGPDNISNYYYEEFKKKYGNTHDKHQEK